MKTIHWALALAMTLSVISCKHQKEEITQQPIRVKTICVAQNNDTSSGKGYPGTIEAGEETPMSFQIAGTIKRVNVKVGDKVTKGQMLATLDATSLQQAYSIALASEEQANDAYNRMKILHDQKALAEIRWVEVKSTVKQARAATDIARKALADANLIAPYSGVVSAKLADNGQTVAPFEPVVNIMTIKRPKASVSIPENAVTSISVGDKGIVTCGGKTYPSSVCEKGVSANPLTRSYTVKLTIDENTPTDSLLPGMICQVDIKSSKADTTHVIELPLSAVLLSNNNKNFVWLSKDSIAQQRFITIGNMTDNGVIVTSGLEHGDYVIVSGQQKVSEGMRVTPVN
ncbi:efflux RND transporter periplasmic adaptor subunit [uncultured Muribaculum sp.]|uniref:efflux RND transporter periplasmic adaptor subunit n=1 Tax=uncultured Muribaculum sp. TaxID=1918613 RepID=UPI0025A987CD|nr:efflux RND transporter periplasmic adaptor subunit [uncultured Muribaculum sp.]